MKTGRSYKRLALIAVPALLAVALVSGYLVGRARAAIPTTQVLTYSAVLTDTTGAPVTGSKNIQIQVWDAATAGNLACMVGPNAIDLGTTGAFQLALPAACVTAVHSNPDLWVELLVNGASIGRAKLGAVPYAVEADTASNAAGALKTTLDGLVPTVIRVADVRTGCPPTQAADTDLVSLPFTLTKGMTVRLSGDMIRNALGRLDLALRLDGTEVFRTLTYTPTAQWAPAHVEWSGTVAAGAHTAVLHGFDANAWGCGAPWGAMSVVITP
jgi:hypothetical protein